MAFLNTNFRKTQYTAVLRTSAQVLSNISFVQFSFSQRPPPPTGEAQLMYQLHAVGKYSYLARIVGSWSFSGDYLAATLWFSQTYAGGLDATITVVGVFKWLIGSR